MEYKIEAVDSDGNKKVILISDADFIEWLQGKTVTVSVAPHKES